MNATPITDTLINADKMTTGDVARAMRALELEVYELRAWKSGGEMSRDECNARRVQLEQELERARQDRNSAAMEVRRQFLPLLELAESALRLATDELQTECEKVVELMDKLGVAERGRDAWQACANRLAVRIQGGCDEDCEALAGFERLKAARSGGPTGGKASP